MPDGVPIDVIHTVAIRTNPQAAVACAKDRTNRYIRYLREVVLLCDTVANSEDPREDRPDRAIWISRDGRKIRVRSTG